MTEVIDKNKSAFKLKGIGPVYCINLDGQTDRWEYMENQFKYWEIEDKVCLLYTSPSPRDQRGSRMPSSA